MSLSLLISSYNVHHGTTVQADTILIYLSIQPLCNYCTMYIPTQTTSITCRNCFKWRPDNSNTEYNYIQRILNKYVPYMIDSNGAGLIIYSCQYAYV